MINAIISAEVMGLLISLAIMYGGWFESKQRHVKKNKVFFTLVLVNAIAMATDMFSWLLDGNELRQTANYVYTFFSLALSFIVGILFLWYMYLHISEKSRISPKPFVATMVFSIVSIVVLTIACCKGYTFSINDGYFQIEAGYNIYVVANTLSMFLVFIIICRNASLLGLHDTVAIMSYIIVPVISIIIGMVKTEFSVTYPAICISILIVYIMLQAEHENNLINKDILKTYQATHDELTGLLNRRAFGEVVEQYKGGTTEAGIIFGDINGLKYTNDKFGHTEGDKMICRFADMLSSTFRRDDIYRISGDEFIVILPDVGEDVMNAYTQSIRNRANTMSPSIAAIGSAYGEEADILNLVKLAEEDMYREKEIFYKTNPDMLR